MKCPVCGGKTTGRVAQDQYYCWDCCIEYRINEEGTQIFELSEDGSLVLMDPADEYSV